MLTFAEKQAIVADVAIIAADAHSAVAAEYRGITVDDMTALRVKARESGVSLRVVKNTLAKRAVENTEFECIADLLVGPLVLAFSNEEPSAAARVINDFAKENDKLVVKAVALRGKLLDPSDLQKLATMPTKDEAISMLMSVMKAPIEKLVRTLAEPNNKLARTLDAVRNQKDAA
ncbi:LSU ribosomal protein L10p (P0) [hydrothermal vent metagenome]|uniref:LSU ribosomal protein L10p (P0) n=1 Tax=hydrothermal vent metagenome TaxID=652676 RepID=A0A3B0YX49_9ZZZZ